MSSVRPHLPEEELHAFLDGQLSTAQRAEIAEHLLACLICRALEAEVRLVRQRSIALLAIAAPTRIRGIPRPIWARPRRRLRPTAAAAAAVLVAAASWAMSRPGDGPVAGGPVLATAFVAPAILARVTAPAEPVTPAARPANPPSVSRTRTLTLASRAAMAPRVIPVREVASIGQVNRLRVVDPMVETAPSEDGAGWQTATLQEARGLAAGAIAHLEGIPVNAVRLQASRGGGRPTAMVRQLLPDGRVVWVVEGNVDDLAPVTRMLEASGLTLAAGRRAIPDYLGTAQDPIRTVRMVTVAAYLPIDSLEALAATRLKLE